MTQHGDVMTLEAARRILMQGGELVELAEAFTAIATDGSASLEDLILGLRHPGFVAEQAALTLYKRTGRPLPDDRGTLMLDPDDWRWVLKRDRLATTDRPSPQTQ